MEKKFVFRLSNHSRVEVKVELEENRRVHIWKDGALKNIQGKVFSVTAKVYGHNSLIYVNEPEVLDAVKNGKLCEKDKTIYLEILRLWKNYHLNWMHAGCEHQKEDTPVGDVCPVCGYRFGSAWLYREIPEKDLEAIGSLFNID